MDSSRAFLGKGFAFPPEVDPVTGHFRMAEGEEDIRQAIYIILMTRLKERAMLPEFGCNLQEYIFDLPDTAFGLYAVPGNVGIHQFDALCFQDLVTGLGTEIVPDPLGGFLPVPAPQSDGLFSRHGIPQGLATLNPESGIQLFRVQNHAVHIKEGASDRFHGFVNCICHRAPPACL